VKRVPAHRRTRKRGALLQDSEEEDGWLEQPEQTESPGELCFMLMIISQVLPFFSPLLVIRFCKKNL
jgi:hypothetical protein